MTRAVAESGEKAGEWKKQAGDRHARQCLLSCSGRSARFDLMSFFHICSVKTDMLPSGAMSRLYIANANRHDSGNYSCGKFDASSASSSFRLSCRRLVSSGVTKQERKTTASRVRCNLQLLLSFFASRPKAALGDIAQATVMVHVLIGTQKFSFFSLSYLNEESGDSSESFVLQMTHCPQLHLV
jgi:hypothetical protein